MNFSSTLYVPTDPLTKPLVSFHNAFKKTLDPLPEKNKFVEMAKRIAVIAISILAYPILAMVALIGLPFAPTLGQKIGFIEKDKMTVEDKERIVRIAKENFAKLARGLPQEDKALLAYCFISFKDDYESLQLAPYFIQKKGIKSLKAISNSSGFQDYMASL